MNTFLLLEISSFQEPIRKCENKFSFSPIVLQYFCVFYKNAKSKTIKHFLKMPYLSLVWHCGIKSPEKSKEQRT